MIGTYLYRTQTYTVYMSIFVWILIRYLKKTHPNLCYVYMSIFYWILILSHGLLYVSEKNMKSIQELIHKHGENLGTRMSVFLIFLSQIIEFCQNDVIFEKLLNKFPNLSFTLFKQTIQFFH